jgi:hypothetical protein
MKKRTKKRIRTQAKRRDPFSGPPGKIIHPPEPQPTPTPTPTPEPTDGGVN